MKNWNIIRERFILWLPLWFGILPKHLRQFSHLRQNLHSSWLVSYTYYAFIIQELSSLCVCMILRAPGAKPTMHVYKDDEQWLVSLRLTFGWKPKNLQGRFLYHIRAKFHMLCCKAHHKKALYLLWKTTYFLGLITKNVFVFEYNLGQSCSVVMSASPILKVVQAG